MHPVLLVHYTLEPTGVANMWRKPMSRQHAPPRELIGSIS